MCVARVDSQVIGQQNAPNVARLVREVKVMMARDRAKVQAVLMHLRQSGPENNSVGRFGLSSFGNKCDDWK